MNYKENMRTNGNAQRIYQENERKQFCIQKVWHKSKSKQGLEHREIQRSETAISNNFLT